MSSGGFPLSRSERAGRAGRRLEAALRPAIEAHLDRCPACASLVAAMLRLFASPEAPLPYANTAMVTSPPRGAAYANTAMVTSPPRAGADPALPAALGRYRLGPRIGAGGMGVVFAAYDPELDRPVAVKLLHADRSADLEVQRARMLREAQAMAKLSHPNVVAVFDVGRVADQLFLAMELVEGATLTRWIAERSRTPAAIIGMFVQAGCSSQ